MSALEGTRSKRRSARDLLRSSPLRPRLGHLRSFGQQAIHRVWQRANTLALGAISAGISYAVAATLFGSEDAVFAPIAAVVSTGLSAGHRLRRAMELCFGVLLGLIAADVLGNWLGVGAWQLALAVLLARIVAVSLSASVLLSNQAAVAAVVVMTVSPLLATSPWVRLGDGLVGGVTAVTLTAIFAPDPFRGVSVVIQRVLASFTAQVERLRLALLEDSLTEAEGALAAFQSMTSARQELRDAMAATRERIRLGRSVTRQGQRARLRVAELLSRRIELLISSGIGLSRSGGALVRHPGPVPGAVIDALGELVHALRKLKAWARDDASKEEVRDAAIAAAVTASGAASGASGASTAVSLMVGQLRATVVDVLRILDLDQREAVAALEAAAGRSDLLGMREHPRSPGAAVDGGPHSEEELRGADAASATDGRRSEGATSAADGRSREEARGEPAHRAQRRRADEAEDDEPEEAERRDPEEASDARGP